MNQAFLSMVKNDELAIYNQNFIIGQLVVAAHQPCNIMNMFARMMWLS